MYLNKMGGIGMSNKLKQLFDYQSFVHNEHLDRLIEETMTRVNRNTKVSLSEDELEFVSAAGDTSYRIDTKRDEPSGL